MTWRGWVRPRAAIGWLGVLVLLGGCEEMFTLVRHGRDEPCCEGGAAGAGGSSATSSASSTSSTTSSSSTTGGGGFESGWEPTSWAPPCILQATEPEKAVPALEWEPCPWSEGCQRVKVTWPVGGTMPWVGPTVAPGDGGFHVGALLNWDEGNEFWPRAAIWDGTGHPIAAWRGVAPIAIKVCAPAGPVLTPSRVWLYGDDINNGIDLYATATYAELMSPKALPTMQGSQLREATDDLWVQFNIDGFSSTIYDLFADTAQQFGEFGVTHYSQAKPKGDSVLLRCFVDNGLTGPYECIWNRDTHAVEPLLQPPSTIVPLAATDGKTLVWIETVQQGELYVAGWFYTSPFAQHAKDLVPKKRRPSPPLGIPEVAANDGYFAWANTVTKQIEIYRLEDMHRWVIDYYAAGEVLSIPYVDSTEVWYDGKLTLVRQKLDALGPGDDAPPP